MRNDTGMPLPLKGGKVKKTPTTPFLRSRNVSPIMARRIQFSDSTAST